MSLRIAGRNGRPGAGANRRHPLFSPITIFALAVGLLVPLLFTASYVGALHDPKPHDMPIGVVAPASMSATLISAVNTASQHELKARLEASTSAMKAAIDKQEIDGGLVLKVPATIPIGITAPASMAATLARAITSTSNGLFSVRIEPSSAALTADLNAQKVYGGVVLSLPATIPIGVVAPSIMAQTLTQQIGAAGSGLFTVRPEVSAAALRSDIQKKVVYGGVVVAVPATIPLGIVAPALMAPALAQQIAVAGGNLFTPTIEPSVAALKSAIAKRTVDGGVVVAGLTSVQILTASGTDRTVSQLIAGFGQQLAAKQHAVATVLDVKPQSTPGAKSLTSIQVLTATGTDYTISRLIAGFGQQFASTQRAGATVVDVQPQASGAAAPVTTMQVLTTSGADSTVGAIVAAFGRQLASSQHAAITVVDILPQMAGTPKPLTSVQVYTAGAVNFTASRELGEFGQLFAASQHAAVTVTDVKPLRQEDSTGLSSLYMMIGWVFGGYFLATVVTTIVGFKQWTRKHSLARLGALAICSIASGLLGTVIAAAFGPVPMEHFWAIAGIGTLLVFSTACATAGLQALIGMYGTQVALIVLIMLGNPSSGGIAAPQMLPAFWRAIGPWLPNAAGFTLLRNTLYFGGNNFGSAIPVLCIYMVAGAALLLIFGSSRIALYTPRVETAVEALRPGAPRLVELTDEEASA